MSFDHKAFAFEWVEFQRELRPLLLDSLRTGQAMQLSAFVDANLAHCVSPHDGNGLGPDWREALEAGDVQEIADYALTKYYDPVADHGLSTSWLTEEAELPPAARVGLLGTAIGPSPGALFDPGRMGSYFQTPEQVRLSLASLEGLGRPGLFEFVHFLKGVVIESKGLYVTF